MVSPELLNAYENKPLEELERIVKHYTLHHNHGVISEIYYRRLKEIDDTRHAETLAESRRSNKLQWIGIGVAIGIAVAPLFYSFSQFAWSKLSTLQIEQKKQNKQSQKPAKVIGDSDLLN